MKKLLIMVAVAAAAVCTRADLSDTFLYWNVEATDNTPFSYANLVYALADTPTTWNDIDAQGAFVTSNGKSTPLTAVKLTDLLPNLTGSTFMAQLLDGEGNLLGESQAIAFDDLIAGLYENGMEPTAVSGGYTFSAAAVPEPTSGLLLLLGVAGLALRRRRG